MIHSYIQSYEKCKATGTTIPVIIAKMMATTIGTTIPIIHLLLCKKESIFQLQTLESMACAGQRILCQV